MDLTLIPFVDYADIRRLVGSAAVYRGLEYAEAGKVSDLEWDEEDLSLSGSVSGSSWYSYETSVLFHEEPNRMVLLAGECDCPVRMNCKHVAALLFTTNNLLEGIFNGSGPARRGRGREIQDQPAPEPLARWKQQLDAILHPPVKEEPAYWGRTPPVADSDPIPMALQFELLEEVPHNQSGYGHSRYGVPPRKVLPSSAEQRPQIRLVVRPRMRGAKGQWIVGNMSWESLSRAYYRDELNAEHKKWMQVFYSLYLTTRTGYGVDKWVYLDDFNTPLLWNLLDQAREMGLEFVTAKKDSAVTWAAEANISTSIIATGDGDMSLMPHAVVDGVPINAATMGTLGDPVHGLFWWHSAKSSTPLAKMNLTLAPVPATVGKALKTLIDAREPVTIPASDREQFLESYYPQVRHSLDLQNVDSGSALPEIRDPELVLTAAHTSPAPARKTAGRRKSTGSTQTIDSPAVELLWHWEYQVGETSTRYPMVSGGAGCRDEAFEARLLATVQEALVEFPEATRDSFPHALSLHPGSNEPVRLRGVKAARFSTDALPLIQELDHVRVDTSGAVPDYTELTGTPQIGISTSSTNDGDWFDLGVEVTLDGTKIPFGELFLALATDEEHLMLPNGHYFALKQPEFEQLRKLIEEAKSLQEPGETLKISRYQAGLWEELSELATTADQSESWQHSVSGLLELHEVASVPVPEGLHATLRPYQQEGFDWLVFLRVHGLGGVLADDMGLGKTLQTLALITHTKATAAHGEAALPFLVVAPTSVVSNWAAEARRFAPGLVTRAVTDTLRRSGGDAVSLTDGADVVITSYTLFRLDNEAYAGRKWAGLIFDEAQFVKNHLTVANKLARSFPAPFKLAITGTPMENNLMELWSLFAIAAPGLFPSPTQFADYYGKPIEKEGNADRLKQLRRRIRPLIMRRTKDAVAKDLPPKQEQVLELELAPRHRTIYQRHLQHERQKVMGLLGDMDKNRFAIFKSLTTLRMLSLDASLVDAKYASAPSSKLDVLFEQLEDVVSEGHRALIFSQFTSFLGKARERLDAAGIPYAYLDGKTRKRGEVVDSFKSGQAPVFLISLKSGGFGLNLTEADYCFLLDPWWNPATENQAIDRTHRIGQDKNVMVYRLVAKDTIEEKVMALKEKKAKLFTSVMDDDAMFSNAITADDVRGLFDA